MDPNKPASAPAPPPGWNADEKSGAGYAAPPPYQDYPQYPNAGYPPPGQPGQPGQFYPPQSQGYGPPPQQQYGGAPYGQGYPAGPGQYQPPPGPQGATITVQPTVFVTRPPLANPVNDYLGYSIFTMLCCCLPLGIAALIYSISTRDSNLAGNLLEAQRSSDLARKFNHAALGIGLILCICTVVFMSI